jgi:Tfp pilus assembly protein PilN
MNNDINLIGNKDHASIPTASRKLKIVRAIAIVLLFGVSASAITLYILIAFSPLPQVQQQEQEALTAISLSHPEMTKIALLDDRMKGIAGVLATRNKYDTVLEALSTKLPRDVRISQVSMNEKSLGLTVKTQSLTSLTTFVETLQHAVENKEYKSITLNSIISDNESNIFSLTMSISLL